MNTDPFRGIPKAFLSPLFWIAFAIANTAVGMAIRYAKGSVYFVGVFPLVVVGIVFLTDKRT